MSAENAATLLDGTVKLIDTLLDQARGEGYSVPFIIYSSSRDASHVAQARQRGAFGATNDPGELFELVLAALGKAG